MIASFVLDASIALAWCFPEEKNAAADQRLREAKLATIVVPGLWFIELTNALAVAERRGRIPADKVSRFIELLAQLDIEIDNESPARAFSAILPLCRVHGLSSYDATYLELALRRRLPLATVDRELFMAAKSAGLEVPDLNSSAQTPPPQTAT